jgi:hypothetical protein
VERKREYSMAIFIRLIVRIIPAALVLVVVSGGSIIAGYSVGLSELKFLQEWMGLATVGLGCGGGLTLVGVSALLYQPSKTLTLEWLLLAG